MNASGDIWIVWDLKHQEQVWSSGICFLWADGQGTREDSALLFTRVCPFCWNKSGHNFVSVSFLLQLNLFVIFLNTKMSNNKKSDYTKDTNGHY